jgi:hypothetical protein
MDDKCKAVDAALNHPVTGKAWMSADMNNINCSLEMIKLIHQDQKNIIGQPQNFAD